MTRKALLSHGRVLARRSDVHSWPSPEIFQTAAAKILGSGAKKPQEVDYPSGLYPFGYPHPIPP